MKLALDILCPSATDLAGYLACRHLTQLERAVAEKRLERPPWNRPEVATLHELGMAHERAYLAHLDRLGHSITRLTEMGDDPGAFEETLAAMRSGAEVIVQATLLVGRWFGRADILRRVDRPSRLGDWSYEVYDTKLALETRAGTILQLCLYSDLVAEIQGTVPQYMHVVPPRPDFPPASYRVADFGAYYRYLRDRLERTLDQGGEDAATYPEPVPHCDVCRWWPTCDARRHEDDHLSLVAGISRLQTRELEERAIATLATLASHPLPLSWKPRRGARESYGRLREQARVQLAGRTARTPVHELLPLEPGRGLARLPAPSPGDVFVDLEGDPFVGSGGLEYLFGWTLPNRSGAPDYRGRWALDSTAERAGFEELVDSIMERWARDPGMHVYHYAPYERSAFKRLMGRHATRESEVDRLLRGDRFVDLYAVLRQSLRASVEGYSIKRLEPFFAFEREQSLAMAAASLRIVQRALELGVPHTIEVHTREVVEGYNRDDCLSALALRDWLERLRADLEAAGTAVPRPTLAPAEPTETVRERERRTRELADRLLAGLPGERGERSESEQARWLLAHVLDWHRREEKAPWWEFFRLREMSDEELLDERAGLAGLEFVDRVGGTQKCPVDRYRYPNQDTSIRRGSMLQLPLPAGVEFGEVESMDLVAHTLDVKKRSACAELHPGSAFEHEVVTSPLQAESLMRLGAWVAEHGIEGPGRFRAARDLLLNRTPRIAGQEDGHLRRPGESGVQVARRLALQLDETTLAIQGPPGSGKTFCGARMICDLVGAGRKVGVCAGSHKVIRNLLDEVVTAAAEEKVLVRCIQKVRDSTPEEHADVRESQDNAEVRRALRDGDADVAGGTAWMWAREEFTDAVDVLFVDEAGQMSLTNVLAIAPSTKNLVLLGDPRQLDQPVQGSHPEGTEISSLDHVLQGRQTIPPERGLFLEETWRLHPSICELTSELFYEGRLRARPELERQELSGDSAFAGAGLWFVPVEHEGNQSASAEEVAVVVSLVERLTAPGIRWRDRDEVVHPLGLEDILIVAPYNAQVADLTHALPAARIGTVDKFQGQEAPVVIYSMTTSTPEDAPRGMEFLYSLNRFNVATSRARGACILVGNPRLFEPECQTPGQMHLASAFCRYRERARQVRVPIS